MGMQFMPTDFRSLTDILKREKEFSAFNKSVKENEVVDKFGNIFPEFSKTVVAKSVKNGTLYLFADNSILRSELHLNRKLMVEKINNYFNEKIISDIKFSKI